MLHFIPCHLAILAIATLYYSWRATRPQRRNLQKLHDRVAYMLWTAASRA